VKDIWTNWRLPLPPAVVLQPVTVRPAKDGKYALIAGECRWKASELAKKETIPAIVKVVSDQQALELTIAENLQRQDLSCVDQHELSTG